MNTAARRPPPMTDAKFAVARVEMWKDGFRDEVFGPRASNFLSDMSDRLLTSARSLGAEAQKQWTHDEGTLTRLAGKLKYINAYLELAKCYGKQIGIMTEHSGFRENALLYLAMAKSELEDIETYYT